MDNKNFDATISLKIVIDFIRGNINLDEAKHKLYTLGLDEKKKKKILMETPRDNIVSIKKTKKRDI